MVKACLELPPEKLGEFHMLVKHTLQLKRMSLKQLQMLAGKLNWAATVVRGGRSYFHRLLDVMKPLCASHHKVVIPDSLREDLVWWDELCHIVSSMGNVGSHPTSQWVHVYVDASLKGGGMACGSDWSFVSWTCETLEWAGVHINVQEIMAIAMAIHRWAPYWSNASIIIH